jgi:hypothetical protein
MTDIPFMLHEDPLENRIEPPLINGHFSTEEEGNDFNIR